MSKQYLALIVISIVVLIVFGGIASILPSRRSRQIGNMRIAARKSDLMISVVQIDDVNAELTDRVTAGGIRKDPKKRCVAWAKHYPEEFPGIPEWITYAMDGREPAAKNKKWQLKTVESNSIELGKSYWLEVDRIKKGVPARCVALEATPTEVRWLGYEIIETNEEEFIQTMGQCLDALMDLNVSVWQDSHAAEQDLEADSEHT